MDSKIRLRPANFSDTSLLGTIAARSYWGSSWANFSAPHHRQYPGDFVANYRRKIRGRFLDPSCFIYVAYSTPEDQASEEKGRIAIDEELRKKIPRSFGSAEDIAGYIIFQRISASRAQVTRNTSKLFIYFLPFLKFVCRMYDRINDFAFPNRAMAIARTNSMPDASDIWAEHKYAERWQMLALSVDPEWQRRGVGKMLMREVMEKAERDGLSVGTEATREGEGLYASLDFKVVKRIGGKFEEDGENEDGSSLAVMVWEPERE